MIVRSIDSDGDWSFGKGRNDYLSANDAIGQNIKTRLQSFLGDCFFAMSAGIDWFNLLGSKNIIGLQLSIQATILNTTGVTRIVDFSLSLETNRRLNLQYTVETIYSRGGLASAIESVSYLLLTEGGDILLTEDGSGIQAG
jgi:hypothetical protein